MANKTIRVATDVGGTFTDLVCFETDHAHRQVPHHHGQVRHDAAELRTGRAQRAGQGRRRPEMVDFLAHGTTVVINALTERKGVKVGLITTEGLSRHAGDRAWQSAGFLQPALREAEAVRAALSAPRIARPHLLQGRGTEAARSLRPAGDPRRFQARRASRRSPSASCIPTPIWPRAGGARRGRQNSGRASRWSPRTRSPASGANTSAPTRPCCRPMCSRRRSAICRACTTA